MRFVRGSGPVPCSYFFIGERPGYDENKTGIPFTGKSGRLFNSFLWQFLRLNRSDVYVTNLVHTMHESYKDVDPTQEEIDHDWPIVLQELQACAPDFVVTLGRHATRAFLGSVDMEVVHGIPHFRDTYVVCPSYHPAAGLHNTELSALVAYDFMQAGEVIRGNIEPNGIGTDEYPEAVYQAGTSPLLYPNRRLAVDTEGVPANPWGFSFTQDAGRGWVMREDFEGRNWDSARLIMHNSLYDLAMLRAMGINVPDDGFDDTMIMAYLLCVEPQGLKSLALRHCGMSMMSYDEVIGDAGEIHAADYFGRIIDWLGNPLNRESLGLSEISQARKGRTSASAGKRSKRTSRKSAK